MPNPHFTPNPFYKQKRNKKQKHKNPNNFQNYPNCLSKRDQIGCEIVVLSPTCLPPTPHSLGPFNGKSKIVYKSHKHFFYHHQSAKPFLKSSLFPFSEYSVVWHFKESQATQETCTYQLNVKFGFWLLQEFSVYFQEELEMLHYDYETSPKYEHVACMSK